ncbi:hypothetical protein DOM21_14910 [Bacteriovorax stolpii]|uniref:hypothetical protein n=1 Tax=Bacteriovorax stolpii TaxID=960 RepID=UPI00115861E5|nr:hypothetical protein [Bacteriovorax stolpii]QDK42717.1 hypothetical protein DOM21_14910 [Bacteriovorax stolpii]
MDRLVAYYPSFLRNEPLIWGVSISDLFRLSGVMVVMQVLQADSLIILGATFLAYLVIVSARRLFPRRYFEFYFKKRSLISMEELNAKIKSL